VLTQLLQNNASQLIWSVTAIVILLIGFKIWKFYRISEIDKNYKKFDPQGNIIEQGRPRNIWDYHFFPGISQLWHRGEWQAAVAATLILAFLVAYLYTRDPLLGQLLNITLGVVIGYLIHKGGK
jgi:predicted acyltransferase